MTKKILVMSFGSDAGGIEKSLIEFLRFLSEKDVEIDLYLWRKPGLLFPNIPKKVNVITRRLYPGSLKEGSSKSGVGIISHALWYLYFRFCRILDCQYRAFRKFEGQYDIAISYCQNGYSPYYIIDKVKAKEKYLWYHHGSYEKKGREKAADAWYYSQFTKLITVSNANKAMLDGEFPKLQDKIVVIPNLINEEEIIELSKAYNI